jgi:type II secretory pathway pseudopilin PulG
MRKQLRSDDGFGLIELLIAMAVLQFAIFALIAALSSAHAAQLRAAKTTTAAALASSQIELYRSVQYHEIRLDPTRLAAAQTDTSTSYASDAAHTGPHAAEDCTVPDPNAQHPCNASSLPAGADGRTYRVNTYIVYHDPADGRELKRVTVVVRDPSRGNAVLVRQTTAFDELTGR